MSSSQAIVADSEFTLTPIWCKFSWHFYEQWRLSCPAAGRAHRQMDLFDQHLKTNHRQAGAPVWFVFNVCVQVTETAFNLFGSWWCEDLTESTFSPTQSALLAHKAETLWTSLEKTLPRHSWLLESIFMYDQYNSKQSAPSLWIGPENLLKVFCLQFETIVFAYNVWKTFEKYIYIMPCA